MADKQENIGGALWLIKFVWLAGGGLKITTRRKINIPYSGDGWPRPSASRLRRKQPARLFACGQRTKDAKLFVRLPRHLVNADGFAEALDLFGKQFGAGGCHHRGMPQEMIVGGVADNDAAAAGNTFEPAGQIHFAAKDGVVENVAV